MPANKQMQFDWFSLVKTLIGLIAAGYMTAAGFWGSAVIDRLDRNENRLASLEKLNAVQNTDIAVIKVNLQSQSERDKLLNNLRDEISILKLDIERLKKQ